MSLSSPILVATGNPGKVREIAALLPGFELIGLEAASEFAGSTLVMPDETGANYEENARLKADSLCEQSGLITVADDSGLEVAALDGRPGLHSARYAPTAQARIDKLLQELTALGADVDRSARFVCWAALAQPGAVTKVYSGHCPGRIVDDAAGAGGFGYDPIFYLDDHDCTMAEVAAEVKNRISHRAVAFRALCEGLRSL